MSSEISKILRQSHFSRDMIHVLVTGLPGAGKTGILRHLVSEDLTINSSTPGFVVEYGVEGNFSFRSFTVSGASTEFANKSRHFYSGLSGIIFAVDASDRDRVGGAADQLQAVLANSDIAVPVPVPVLVFITKGDINGALSENEIVGKLGLRGLRDRGWYNQSCDARSGEGIYKGVDWLVERIKRG